LLARPWPGAPAIIPGPGPDQIQPSGLNTAGAPTPWCAGSNLGTYFCHQPATHPTTPPRQLLPHYPTLLPTLSVFAPFYPKFSQFDQRN
jgi:hypothetical protein